MKSELRKFILENVQQVYEKKEEPSSAKKWDDKYQKLSKGKKIALNAASLGAMAVGGRQIARGAKAMHQASKVLTGGKKALANVAKVGSGAMLAAIPVAAGKNIKNIHDSAKGKKHHYSIISPK